MFARRGTLQTSRVPQCSAENKYCTTQQRGSLTQLVIMFIVEHQNPACAKLTSYMNASGVVKGSLRKAWAHLPDQTRQAENLGQQVL